jgi:type IV secretory pathway ATPase VirB11/archaellum biosynthesis ATPase
MSSMTDRATGDGGFGLRPLDQIFPLRGDDNRGREMQATWRSFCRDRLEAVRGVLAAGRSPPEIAYQLGELLHNHFRTRGVTLTSFELRRLVAELLALHGPEEAHEMPPSASEPPSPPPLPASSATAPAKPQPVVAFERESKAPWPGDAPAAPAPAPAVPENALEPPPSPIVTLAPRKMEEEPPVVAAPAEGPALGLIDRLWSDRTVRAIFINGPRSVSVERDGTLHAVGEAFRDEAQLMELMTRLVGRPASGMADFQLRDGSTGFVIFPPVAPAGPVLTLRRAEPGQATLESLVAVGMFDRPVAELLRLCVRSRLNILVVGPQGSGKTVLLAALARDLDPALRVVTVAAHRHFRTSVASKIELVASATAPFAMLLAAATRLDPGLLVLDDAGPDDAAALADRLRHRPQASLATIGAEAMSAALTRAVDLVVRTERLDGRPRVVSVEDSAGVAAFALEDGKLARGKPAFAATLQMRGLGEAVAKWFA